MSIYKVLLAGFRGAGKTEFIKTISDFPLVSVQKRIATTQAFVAMDYGRIRVGRDMLFLYSPAAETDYRLLWDALATDMQGCIILVDSTNFESFGQVAQLIQTLSSPQACCLVVANKTDQTNAAHLGRIRHETLVPANVVVMPCVATQKSSVLQTIEEMLRLLKS
jgi:uncharacterized protein